MSTAYSMFCKYESPVIPDLAAKIVIGTFHVIKTVRHLFY